ncbi:hypothetical protein PC118_g19953 [Phytophthora cactorum]|nr:hypothetical protein PC118_g19953 [Phytophthora cactorum]KAG3059607.1 hypothetical protein PC122_g20244 [Phytophthora cactorum]
MLLPTYAALIQVIEDARRREEGLPKLRRSVRLSEAIPAMDEEGLHF